MRNSNIASELLVNSIGSENEENGVKIVRLRQDLICVVLCLTLMLYVFL